MPSRISTLLPVLRDAGWVASERDRGRVAVETHAPRFAQPILVDRGADGVVRFSTAIARRLHPAEVESTGVGRYLLRLGGRRRLVCAVAERLDPDSVGIRLEVRVREPPEADLVGHAVSVLAMTAPRARAEVTALTAKGPGG